MSTLSLDPPLDAAQQSKDPTRAAEFLLTGGATLFLFPLAWLLKSLLGLDAAELAVGFVTFHAAHVINDPHFTVTYLLFYRDAKNRALGDAWSMGQRVRYWVAGFVVPVALALWLGFALVTRSAPALGLVMELMFLLVGWHYVKQGFGVLTVLSARRGVQFSAFERRVVLAHCFAGWAYAWASPATSAKEVAQSGVVYVALPRPVLMETCTGIVFAMSALALVVVLGRKWRVSGRLPPLAPLTGLLITVWLWTVYSSADSLMVYMIPALHSVQYLFFVWLLRRNAGRKEEASFGPKIHERLLLLAFGALALGWLLFHGAPELLDGAWRRSERASGGDFALGVTPFAAAFFAFVNVHHYFMDHVIWRRENPETRLLRE